MKKIRWLDGDQISWVLLFSCGNAVAGRDGGVAFQSLVFVISLVVIGVLALVLSNLL